MNDDGVAAGVDDAVVAAESRPLPLNVAATSSSTLRGNALILCQVLRLASKEPQAQLGEIGHEDVVEVDQDRVAGRGGCSGCAGTSAPNRCRWFRRPERPATGLLAWKWTLRRIRCTLSPTLCRRFA